MSRFSLFLAFVAFSAQASRLSCKGYGYWGSEGELQIQINAEAQVRGTFQNLQVTEYFVGTATYGRVYAPVVYGVSSSTNPSNPGSFQFTITPIGTGYEGDSRIFNDVITLTMPGTYADQGAFAAFMSESRAPMKEDRRLRCSWF